MPKILKNKWICCGLIIAIVALSTAMCSGGKAKSAFYTTPLNKGSVATSITATGTVEPEEVVDVGAQVAGRIISFGQDLKGNTVDYGSEVENGAILAQIDDALYQADAAKANAELASAKANLEQSKAKLFQAEQDWRRAQKVGPSDLLSKSSYDSYQAAYEVAKANIAISEAAVIQAEAGLVKVRQNLDYCVIKSPVRGTIIDRLVNIGQTVVSSMNAPSLFLIAKDMRRMQVWVSVNEADIGNIYTGQPVTFSVDAFPGEIFKGEVTKVRLNATMSQNVVTYIVEVFTDNSSGRLIPYLTANVIFEGKKKDNVFVVPNAALRWAPTSIAAAASSDSSITQLSHSHIWVLEDSKPREFSVKTGLSDGVMTEIEGEGLKEGALVITGENMQGGEGKSDSASSATQSPFTPKAPSRPR